MRRVGAELGVEAMSLYNHVANKGDLLDGMVDVVFSEIELPSGDDVGPAETMLTAPALSGAWAGDFSSLYIFGDSLVDKIFEEGLKEAGFTSVTMLSNTTRLVDHIYNLDPDVVLQDALKLIAPRQPPAPKSPEDSSRRFLGGG